MYGVKSCVDTHALARPYRAINRTRRNAINFEHRMFGLKRADLLIFMPGSAATRSKVRVWHQLDHFHLLDVPSALDISHFVCGAATLPLAPPASKEAE